MIPTIGQERGWLKRAGGRERAAVGEEEEMGGNNSGFPFGEGAGALRMEGDDRDSLGSVLGSLSFFLTWFF